MNAYFGDARITVTVEDGGLDLNLDTTSDNGVCTQSFLVTTAESMTWVYWSTENSIYRSLSNGLRREVVATTSEPRMVMYDINRPNRKLYTIVQDANQNIVLYAGDIDGRNFGLLTPSSSLGRVTQGIVVNESSGELYVSPHALPTSAGYPDVGGMIRMTGEGQNVTTLAPKPWYVIDMEVDDRNGHLYYSVWPSLCCGVTSGWAGIRRMNLDGTNDIPILETMHGSQIALDIHNSRIFFSVSNGSPTMNSWKLYQMNLDGSQVEAVVNDVGWNINDVEMSRDGSRLYYSSSRISDGIQMIKDVVIGQFIPRELFQPTLLYYGMELYEDLVPNRQPTLDSLLDIDLSEDSELQIVNLSGITAGASESQPLRVTATSSNPSLITTPNTSYTSPDSTGSIIFSPLSNRWGTSTIIVSVEDGGLDGNLDTAADNATFSRSFTVTVNPVNDAPTLDPLSDRTIPENSASQLVSLTGITAGGSEAQPVRVTATSSNPALIPNPVVDNNDFRFQAGADYAAGDTAHGTESGDFNGDSILDVAVVHRSGGNVSVYYGTGNGTFQDPVFWPMNSDTYSMAIADFNGDGLDDIAVTNFESNLVSVRTSTGNGFSLLQAFSTGNGSTWPEWTGADPIQAGDFNNDGKIDLVVGNTRHHFLSVLLGDGLGRFLAPIKSDVDPSGQLPRPHQIGPISLTVADFNRDGKLDVAVGLLGKWEAGADIPGDLRIMLGDGNGNFSLHRQYESGQYISSVLSQDFNGDTYADIVISSAVENGGVAEKSLVYLGDGNGNFSVAQTLPTGATGFRTADINKDGNVDILAFASSSSFFLYHGNGAGSFSGPLSINNPRGANRGGVVGDFDGNGWIDVAWGVGGGYVTGTLSTWLGRDNSIGTLTLSPTANQSGVATITVTVEDGGPDGDLATTADNATFSRSFTVTVQSVNDAPTNISLSSGSIPENADANTTVGTLSTSDVDVGDTHNYTLVSGSGDADNAHFNISGSTLRAASSFDFETKSSYSVRVRSTDQDGLFVEKAFTITVIDVNESPTDINLSGNTIGENAPADTPVGTLSTVDPDARNSFTYTLVAGSGDSDNAAFSIVGSTLRASSGFDFETKSNYTVRVRSTDQNGLFVETAFVIQVVNVNESPTDITLSSTTIAENAGINATVGVLNTTDVDAGNSFVYSFVAGVGDADNTAFTISGSTLRATSSFDFETKSSYSVRVRSTDQDGLFVEKAFTITVIDVNESPTDINLSGNTIGENAPADTPVGTLSTVDPDAGNSFTYTLVAGSGDTDNAAFSIVGSTLRASSGFDFETKSNYTVRVRSTDQNGLFVEKAFVIQVVNVNESPTDITLSSTMIAENAGANATVGALSTTDVDAGNSFVYSFVAGVGDADNTAFTISGSTLRAASSFDFETKSSYSVRVRSTDQDGLFVEKAFAIQVVNVNETPSDIGLSWNMIAENAGVDTTIGTLSTIDVDAGNTFAYSLATGTGDADNASFRIIGSTLVAISSFDFETKSTYTVRVRSTDQDGLFTERAFIIRVVDTNESPTDINLSASSIAENSPTNTPVGTLSTADPDAGNSFTYTLVAGSGDADNGSFDISGNSLRAASSFNYEAKSSYSVRVRSTDQNGLFFEKVFPIQIVNVNETPTDINLSSSIIHENAAVNTSVGTMSTADPDAGNSFTYTLVAGAGDTDNAAFNIAGSILRATSSFNFETKSSFSVRVRSTDQNGLFIEKAFTIQVVNVNEAPTDISLSSNSIPENSASNTTVGTFSTTDVDTGNTFAYSFAAGVGDADNAAFTISGATLRATSNFNFESKPSYSIRVRSSDQGGLFVEKIFTIQVIDVNEAPTDINLTSTTIPENAGSNATVGTLSTADVDAGSTFVYSLVAGSGDTDNAAFSISGSSLRATSSFDFETRSDYTVRVRSTDQGGLFVEKVFAISVVNANDAPVALGESYWVSVDSPQMLNVLANDSDIDSTIDPTSIEIVQSPLHGTATPMQDGTVRYIPNAGYRGVESFTYRVRDSLGLFSNAATVQLRVNSAPNTNPDSFVVKQTITTVVDVLRNDSDPDGSLDPATLVIVSSPDMADVVVQPDGTIRFTPRTGFLGTTQFRYVVSDNEGRPSAPTDVTVLVVVSIYQNPRNRFDVDNDGTVSPLDVLVLINLLNTSGPSLTVDGLPGPPPYVDVNADNRVDPLDVLEVINHINSRGGTGGEGEGGAGLAAIPVPVGTHVREISPVAAEAVIDKPTEVQMLSLDEYFERLGRGRSLGVRAKRS